MNGKFYTPDGFTDILPGICRQKKELEQRLRNLFGLYGYDEIETPGVEYCDVYTSTGFVGEENLYKYTDQKGRLLCSRYDGTIPAARLATRAYVDAVMPVRLCYIENMYRFNQSGGGKQSGFTQAGVELMGAGGLMADTEVIALAIRSALEIGITDLQVSVGDTEFYAGLVRQLGLSADEAKELKAAIRAKNPLKIEQLGKDLGERDRETLRMLTSESGTYDVIEAFRDRVTDEGALAALANLEGILKYLEGYDYLKYITVDMGLMGSVDYYTGMIFKGYTYEVGFPVISGGRYDKVAEAFGRDMPAVGFQISLTLSLTALMRQKKLQDNKADKVLIGGAPEAVLARAEQLRGEGVAVAVDITGMNEEELSQAAGKAGIETVIYLEEGEA